MQVFINQINIEFIKGEQQQKPLNILVLWGGGYFFFKKYSDTTSISGILE